MYDGLAYLFDALRLPSLSPKKGWRGFEPRYTSALPDQHP